MKLSPKAWRSEKLKSCTLEPGHGRAWLATVLPGLAEALKTRPEALPRLVLVWPRPWQVAGSAESKISLWLFISPFIGH
ncbi:hypothetical protein A2U01_0020373 [Trifolium medium]|uniref:Uncharacterized protein n=1 Tax=Trifolium medium TaxID=97028 RepID=A0A392NIU9_9FABA|nr:hypothetical protein [Trifolium medium]